MLALRALPGRLGPVALGRGPAALRRHASTLEWDAVQTMAASEKLVAFTKVCTLFCVQPLFRLFAVNAAAIVERF